MRKTIYNLFYLLLITTFISSVSFVNAQNRAYRVRDSQVQYLLNRIEQRTDSYKRAMNTALDRSVLQNTDTEDMVMNYITDCENSTDALSRKFDSRDSVSADVEDVLTRAAYINAFMQRNRLNSAAQAQWNSVRSDLNTLASYSNVGGPVDVSGTINAGGPGAQARFIVGSRCERLAYAGFSNFFIQAASWCGRRPS